MAPSASAAGLTYRPEVDGLRAVAVVAAILFHTGSPTFAAGYLGVDLFFVISGYLITGILLRDQAVGAYTFAGFYMRRIRRILPAMLAIMLLTAIPALLWLVPDQLQNFGQSLTASALMANNVLLWLTGGYWDTPARFKPLLHTWSLGVEEQFYLLGVPLMLLALLRAGRRGLGLVLVLVVLVSASTSMIVLPRDYDAVYLLLPFRAWELALGGLVALLPRERLLALPAAPWLAAGGGALAIAALTGLAGSDAASLAPLLLACTGCALLLATAQATSGLGAMLALRPLVIIGLASFSAYLLHQPVFAFVRVLSLEEPSTALLIGLVPAILLMALASWRWIEQPMRDPRRVSDRAVMIWCGLGTGLATALGLVLHFTNGLATRVPELGGNPGDNIAYVDAVRSFEGRPLDPADRAANLLVIGHSQGRDLINMAIASGSLAPERISYAEKWRCEGPLPQRILAQARAAGTVVLAISWDPVLLPCAGRWTAQLRQVGAEQILLLGFKQFGWSNSAVFRLPQAERHAWRARPADWATGANHALVQAVPAGRFIDPLAPITDAAGRVPVFTPDRLLISQDGLHLTPAGARWLGEKLFALPQFDAVTRRRGA
jgi:peptidoglycan/LPS O-acetylase OafA/YrhL